MITKRGYGTYQTHYGPYGRFEQNGSSVSIKIPTLKCWI